MRTPAVPCAALALAALLQPAFGEDIYYRKDENGALVLTNVPDHGDLRRFKGSGTPGVHSGARYRGLIHATAVRHGIHPDLVYAVASVESSFNPAAVSVKGAQGLMQLMPDTAARFGVKDPFDPADNVLGGVRYLKYLLDLFDGDVRLAVAAYNAGESVVSQLKGIPPYRETRGYVAKVMRLFGPRRPYVDPPPRRPAAAAAGGTAPAAIHSYTDDGGVTHYSDSPPPAGDGAPDPPPGPR